jgi:hypothetical protein
MPQQPVAKKRPFGVTLLAILAGVAAVLAGIHALQALGIFPYVISPLRLLTDAEYAALRELGISPYFISPVTGHAFNLWNAFMWGLMVWVWVWLIQMLWRVDPQAWLFLAVITVFNLVMDFMMMIGSAGWSDVSLSFIVNAIILIYVMLPGTKRAFGTAK